MILSSILHIVFNKDIGLYPVLNLSFPGVRIEITIACFQAFGICPLFHILLNSCKMYWIAEEGRLCNKL